MLYVLSNSFNPYYNLATEEYLLKNFKENIFMLWQSEFAVIVGKHQNALAEINSEYVLSNNIKVARRISGGGTVVHDFQNLNFSFIANGEEGKLIDFKKYITPIIDYLHSIGIVAHIGKTNDIRIGDLKISGNAEHVFKKRVLHHGTLLFNSNLQQLRATINVGKGKYSDKAVQSNRASVTNIIDHLQKKISIEDFTNGLISFIAKKDKFEAYSFSEEEIEEITKLVENKYYTDKWIWAYSPRYKFKNSFEFNGEIWGVELRVEKGIIQDACIKINFIENQKIQQSLVGKWHKFEIISEAIISCCDKIKRTDIPNLAYSFF